jgi:hypothetical protein
MLPSKTVFVLGAGASFEAGLPIGDTLKKHVAQALDFDTDRNRVMPGRGDEAIYKQLVNNGPSGHYAIYFEAARSIQHGLILSASIDDFIDAHQDEAITVCGKLAITRSILKAERASKLYVDPGNMHNKMKFHSLEGTWYLPFYRLLTQGLQRSNLETLFNNVTLITFNYDRCPEHFLTYALAANYRLQLEESRKLVQTLRILRPYGSVGAYLTDEVRFGGELLPPFKSVLSNLRTYGEKTEDAEGLAAIQAAVAEADVMVFLGNAYEQHEAAGPRRRPSEATANLWHSRRNFR